MGTPVKSEKGQNGQVVVVCSAYFGPSRSIRNVGRTLYSDCAYVSLNTLTPFSMHVSQSDSSTPVRGTIKENIWVRAIINAVFHPPALLSRLPPPPP